MGRARYGVLQLADAILSERPITLFNQGKMARDFTHVGNLAEAIERLTHKPPSEPSRKPHRVVNIVSGRRMALVDFVAALERAFGCEAQKTFANMQAGDLVEIWGDISLLNEITGYAPQTIIDFGIKRFA
jgi:UDP-glucuronate 4-epimerase